MATTFDRLCTILIERNKLSPGALTPEATFKSLDLDSLTVIELLFNVEDEFKITLPAENVSLATLGDVVRHIDELVAVQHRVRGSAPGDEAMIATTHTP